MVTINKKFSDPTILNEAPCELALDYRGLSTDEKPNASNGSTFLEIDTGKVFGYDAEGKTWIEW